MTDNREARLVIRVAETWPWDRHDWRYTLRHPVRMASAVKLFLLVKLLRKLDPAWDRKYQDDDT